MLKTLTILLTLTVFPAITTAQDLNNTCAPNQMTISDAIKSMRHHGLKVMAYDGDNAKVVRDYMQKATGMEMLEFDAIIFGSKGEAANTLAMTAKGGCVFNGGPVATELYLRVVAEVEGI